MKRWRVIRHIRFWIMYRRVARWARAWGEVGIGLGYINPSDEAHLKDIWDGKE